MNAMLKIKCCLMSPGVIRSPEKAVLIARPVTFQPILSILLRDSLNLRYTLKTGYRDETHTSEENAATDSESSNLRNRSS